jgi:hypothetical protein
MTKENAGGGRGMKRKKGKKFKRETQHKVRGKQNNPGATPTNHSFVKTPRQGSAKIDVVLAAKQRLPR